MHGNRYLVNCGCLVVTGWRRGTRFALYGGSDDDGYYHLMTAAVADAQAHLFALIQVPPPAVYTSCLLCVCECACVCVATAAASALVSAAARVVNGQTSLPRSSSSATRRARSLSSYSCVRRACVLPSFFFFHNNNYGISLNIF